MEIPPIVTDDSALPADAAVRHPGGLQALGHQPHDHAAQEGEVGGEEPELPHLGWQKRLPTSFKEVPPWIFIC